MPRIRDILIVPTDARFADRPEWDTHLPAGWDTGPAALGDGITIERVTTDEAEAVMDASGPAGKNFHATRQFGQLYAFVRAINQAEYDETHYNWDASGALTGTIVLSRLVLDNAYCSEFAGRIVEHDGGRTQIIPLNGFEQRLAYRLRDTRFWLTDDEVDELATLRAAYDPIAGQLPGRVGRALWRTERSTHTRYLSEAVTHIVTGLEALLKTERHTATQQFMTRAPALADAVGLDGAAIDWDAVYAARSDASHGAEVELFAPPGHSPGGEPPPEAVTLVAAAQDVLRAAVRRAIEDEDFRLLFADADAVRAAWPV